MKTLDEALALFRAHSQQELVKKNKELSERYSSLAKDVMDHPEVQQVVKCYANLFAVSVLRTDDFEEQTNELHDVLVSVFIQGLLTGLIMQEDDKSLEKIGEL